MRIRSTVIGVISATLFFTNTAMAVTPKAGSGCSQLGQSLISAGKKFTCIKSGKKLVWSMGVAVAKATPATTPTGDDINLCKLPVADGRGDVAIGGWPRISERQKTIGNVIIKVVLVDFSDAPASRTPQEAFALLSAATNTFKDTSYGKLNFELQPTLKWYRMSKTSASYAPLNQSFLTHRAYIQEAINLADPDVDFSKADGFLILGNPDSKLGYSGPGFAAVNGMGVTVDGKYLSNGATSAQDLLNWGSIWLNHEMTHTMGLIDLYAFAHSTGSSDYWDFHRFVGQFSWMGFSDFNSNSPSLLAYERWYLNWLDDSQIVCTSKSITQLITPIESTGGVKALIIPISRTKEIVIESRRAIGLDSKIAKTGALIYLVDSAIQSGRGAVQIFPSDLIGDPKYLKSPRAAGESLTLLGYTIKVDDSSATGDLVTVTRN